VLKTSLVLHFICTSFFIKALKVTIIPDFFCSRRDYINVAEAILWLLRMSLM